MCLKEVFFTKLESAKINGDCVEWPSLTKGGYGQFSYSYKKYSAHRTSWEIHNNAQIPKGKVIMHTCDNPSCVNPEHLRLGTQSDNVKDMIEKGRANYSYDRSGESNPNSKVSRCDVAAIFEESGTHEDVAGKYVCPVNAVKNIRNRRTWLDVTKGLTPGDRGVSGTRGSNVGSSKLQEFEAVDIFTSKEKNRALASRYNCSISVIQRVKNGDTWKHVTKNTTRG